MIYKFIEPGVHETEMEAWLIDKDSCELNQECVVISVKNMCDDHYIDHHLTKNELYKLIGALHMLYKEMK